MAPGEPMPKTTDKMLAAFDAKGVMVSITLRYTRPGLSAPTYLVRPEQPARAAGPHASAKPAFNLTVRVQIGLLQGSEKW